MSNLNANDFPSMSPYSAAKLAGAAQRKTAKQGTAASATIALFVAEAAGVIGDAGVDLGVLAASGESMTVDVQKNGTSVMTGGTAYTYDSTVTAHHVDLFVLMNKDKLSYAENDVWTAVLTYTAGGGPAPMNNMEVWVEPTFTQYR